MTAELIKRNISPSTWIWQSFSPSVHTQTEKCLRLSLHSQQSCKHNVMSFSHWSRAEVCGGGLTDGQNTDTHQGCDRACSVRKRLVGFFSIIFLMKSLAVDRQMVYIHIYTFNIFVSNILEHWLLHRVVLKTLCRSRRWMGGQRCCTAPPKSSFWNYLHKSSDRKPSKKPTCQSSTLLTNPLRSLRSCKARPLFPEEIGQWYFEQWTFIHQGHFWLPESEMSSQKGEWKAYSALMILEKSRVSFSSKKGG